MEQLILKEKTEQLDRFNNLISLLDKMTNNMQTMANRIVVLEQAVKRLEEAHD